MKRMTVLLLCLVLGACSTLRPILEPEAQIRQELAGGQLLKAGDSVRITTDEGIEHSFIVTALGAGVVAGRGVSIPIEHIARVEKRGPSVAKSLLLLAGIAAALVASKGYSETHHRSCSGGTIC